MREADRRFALLVALMAPDERHGERPRPRRDGGEGQDRSMEFAPPLGSAERQPRLRRQRLTLLLFAGCATAAVLLIVIASLVKF